MIRRPIEPVSTSTSLIATQVVVPCWQTVMFVRISLTKPPADPLGPKLATTSTVFLTAVVPVPVLLLLLPPHPANTSKHITPGTKALAINLERQVNASPPRRHCLESGRAHRRFPCKAACDRNWRKRNPWFAHLCP